MAAYLDSRNQRVRFQYTDWQGTRRTVTPGYGTTLKEASKLFLRIQGEHDDIRRGLRPAPSIASKIAFTDAMGQYLKYGETNGGRKKKPWSAIHRKASERNLKFWGEKLTLESLAGLEKCVPKVEAVLQGMRAKGSAGKTLNNYAETLSGFCTWAVKRSFLSEHPLKNLTRFDASSTRKRRAMTPDEIRRLLKSCSPANRILYETALCSGLRANELRSLKIKHLDAAACGLILDAEWTKDRENGLQYLPESLVKRLAEASAGKAPDDRLFEISQNHAGRSLQRDAVRAGIDVKTGEGILDFHALRVAYTTLVLETGASVKETMSMARHKSPNLTMNVYGRARNGRLRAVVEAVGNVVLAPIECKADVSGS